ncbi:MAG: ATP-binding protein, partial [Anaerolineaceae bacterium]|nr:ATP-binding protein [Anaerolineaceae bacterium]
MKENSIDIVKSVATLAGAALAGPTGGFIGNLSSTILQAVIPGMPAILRTFQANILSTLVTDQTRKLIPKLTEKDRRMVNHDLQTAFRDAFIEAVQDIGGEECFPAAWKQDPKVIPPAAIYPKSTGKRLWQSRSSLASQVEECLQALVQAVKDGKVLPLDPPEKMQAGDVRSFLESDTPEKLTGTFFEQVLAPFLSGYQSLLVELPDLLHHLKLHLLDRTLVYLGENLKKRTPAWRAYNRLVLEEMRSQLTELGQGQKDLLSRMDNLLDRLQDQSSGGLTDGLADLLSAVGSIDKKMDEQFSAVMGRLTSQHQELVSNLEQISLTSLRIESKVDRVLRILEDGRFLVEGTPPVAVDIQPEPGEAPFQGMQYFDEKDAPRFFGREVLVAKLAGRLQDARFLTVVGASGSGKSSLVRAGLLPALRSGKTLAGGLLPPVGCQDWLIHLITPGEHPLEALAVNLTGESGSLQAATHLRDDLMKEPRSLALA